MPNRPASFIDLINSSQLPILVDFYADWCGPCKVVSPIVSRIAKGMKGKILTVKINVDKKPQISQIYQISSIPTLMLFKNGKSIMRLQGAHSYETILNEVNKALL